MSEKVNDKSEAVVRDSSGDSVEKQATTVLQDQANDLRRNDRPAASVSDEKSLGLPTLALVDTGSGARDLYDKHQGPADKKGGDDANRVSSDKTEQKIVDPAKAPEKLDGKTVDPAKAPEKLDDKTVDPAKAPEKLDDKTVDPAKAPEKLDGKTVDPAKAPEKAAQKHLTETQEKEGLVQSKEGPYQVAGRLLGKDASHEEKMALAKAMKTQYNAENGNKDPQMASLSVGHSLLNEKNFEKVIANIKDEAMSKSISAKLDKQNAESKKEEPKKDEKRVEPKKEEPKKDEKRVEPKKEEPKKDEKKVEPKKEEKKDLPKDKAEPGKDAPRPDSTEPTDRKVGPLGTRFVPVTESQPIKETVASVYSSGHTTASTRHFNPNEPTVAIKPEVAKAMGLHFGDVVRITHGGRSTDAVYTDAGPFVKGRGIDLSTAVGRKLGITVDGIGIGTVKFQKIGREPDFMGHTRRKKH